MNDEQIYAMSVLLVAASGRTTPLTMQAAEEMLREIVSLPRGPFTAAPPAFEWHQAGNLKPTGEVDVFKAWQGYANRKGVTLPLYAHLSPDDSGVAIPLEGRKP